MRTLFPAATACFVVMLVASAGYAEAVIESSADEPTSTSRVAENAAEKPETSAASDKESAEDVAEVDTESADSPVEARSIEQSADARRELSAAPLAHVDYPDDRPAWVENEPDLEGEVHRWVVTTSGCESMEQCEAQLDALVPAAVALYIKESTGWVCDDSVLDGNWIDDQLVSRRYIGTIVQGGRELHEIAVELEIGPQAQRRVRAAMNDAIVNDRIRAAGGLFALGLIGLCCTGGLLGVFSRRFS